MKILILLSIILLLNGCASKAGKSVTDNPQLCRVDLSELDDKIWLKRPIGFLDHQQKLFFEKNVSNGLAARLPSGVQFVELRKGCGPRPNMSNIVEVRYHGTLLGGKVFDSSYLRGEAAKFKLDSVIEGWKSAVQHMKVGAIWEIYIPHELGYGSEGVGPIPPYSPLLFTVELVSFK